MKFNFQRVIKSSADLPCLSLIVLFSIFLFTFVGCKRDLGSEIKPEEIKALVNEQDLLQSSKEHLRRLVNEEKNILSQPTKKLPKNSLLRKNTRLASINDLVNWEGVKLIKENGNFFIIVPFNEAIKPFNNKRFEFYRSLIFYIDSTGKNQMNIIEILGDKDASLGNNFEELIKTAFLNKRLGQEISIGNLNAHVMFYNDKYKEQNVFRLENGKWSLPTERFSFRSDFNIN